MTEHSLGTVYRYRASQRDGWPVFGVVCNPDSIGAWIEGRFRAGWNDLTVTSNNREVGGIKRTEEGRSWWVK